MTVIVLTGLLKSTQRSTTKQIFRDILRKVSYFIIKINVCTQHISFIYQSRTKFYGPKNVPAIEV